MSKSSVATRLLPGLAVALVLGLSLISPSRTSINGTLAAACGYGYAGQPAVTSVYPPSGPVAGGTTVTVLGCGFTGATFVRFGATASSFVVNSDSQITATSPAHAAGTVHVTVTTPTRGTSLTSAADQFTYTTPAAYTAVVPVRLMDSRVSGGPLGAGGTRDLAVAGVSPGAPAAATSVVINVTVTNTTAASFLTVYPAGSARPLASNLNWPAGKTIPNLVTVQVGGNGSVTIYNAYGSTDVVVDLEGYFSAPSGTFGQEVALTPARITDTRTGSGQANAGSHLTQNSTLSVQVTGQGGVPLAGVSGVILNATVVNTQVASFLTVYPTGATQPLASNVNWTANVVIPNRVFVPIGTGGKVNVYNAWGTTDVVLDVTGYFTDSTAAGQNFTTQAPLRIADTRGSSTLGPGGTYTLQVAGIAGVPFSARAVIINVTVTNTTAPSFLTVYPSTGTLPLASDLNWIAGTTIPNLTVATLGATGAITFYNAYGSTDVVVDLAGWFS